MRSSLSKDQRSLPRPLKFKLCRAGWARIVPQQNSCLTLFDRIYREFALVLNAVPLR